MAGIENMAEGAGQGPEIPTAQASSGAAGEQKANTPQISSGAALLRNLGAVDPENPARNPAGYISRSVAVVSQLGAVAKKEDPQAEGKGPELESIASSSAIVLKDIFNQLGAGIDKEKMSKLLEKLKELTEEKHSDFQVARQIIEAANLTDEQKASLSEEERKNLDILLPQSRQIMENILLPLSSTQEKKIREEVNKQGLSPQGAERIVQERLKARESKQEGLDRVLYFVRDDIRRRYLEAVQPDPRADPESWNYSPSPKSLEEKMKALKEGLKDYEESFWKYGELTLKKIFGDRDINVLRQEYEGVASFVASAAAIAIEKELRGVSPLSKDFVKQVLGMSNTERRAFLRSRSEFQQIENFGDFFLLDIKGEIQNSRGEDERRRREARKRATADERLHYNNWREKFDFTWAETAEELDDSLEDWLDYFQQQLPLEAEDKVYELTTTGLHNVLASLEQARNRIGIPANSEIAHRLREKATGHVKTIAGARLLETKGGFEYFIKLRTDFASNYEGYYNRMYLREGFARTAREISKNNGAIYKGGPEWINKPLAGNTREFRSEIERDIIRDSVTYELYVTRDDIEKAVEGREKIRREVGGLGLSPEEAEKIVQERLKEKMGRYGWGEDDWIEQLMLKDVRGWRKARDIAPNDPNNPDRKAAEERVKTRTELFRKMKRDLDKEDTEIMEINGRQVKVHLADLNEEQRKAVIRQRIEMKMVKEKDLALLNEIKAMTEEEAHKQGFATTRAAIDHALWKWVRDYNNPLMEFRREGSSDEPWFPSIWDRERLLIRDAEDLIDRSLEENEIDAMYEEVNDGYKGLTDKQMRQRIEEEVKTGFKHQVKQEVEEELRELAAKDEVIPAGEADRRIAEKMASLSERMEEAAENRIGDVVFKREQRQAQAIRNYNLNIAQDKFLGLQARYGGLTTRVIDERTGGTKLVTIYELAEEILKAKIDKEEAEVEAKVEKWAMDRAAAGATLAQIEVQKVKQRRLFRRHCVFAATLGLRELKIAKDLPIYNLSYYSDVSQIGAFAPLVGYTDDEKDKLVELLDRARREKQAVFSFLAAMHMDGRILVVKDEDELVIEDKEGNQKPAHEEERVRPRVINEGGVLKLRDIFESAFMISTSGGVKVPDLIAKMAWLGVYDELYENGCKDKLQWQNFRRRRNKWELREQSFYNIREWTDPLTYVERLAGAAKARKFLVGGEVQGQGDQPGVLNETMKGAWRMRRALLKSDAWLSQEVLKILGKIKTITSVEDIKAELQKVLEQNERTKGLSTTGRDELVETAGDVIAFLRAFLKSRDYQMNKAGYASGNWHYDNELITHGYLQELVKREPKVAKKGEEIGWVVIGKDATGKETFKKVLAKGGEILATEEGEALGSEGQAFAIQGRSQLARDIYEGLLRGSTYEIPDENHHMVIAIQAREAKEKLDKNRQNLLDKLLPVTTQVAIAKTKEQLKQQDDKLNKVKLEFAGLFKDKYHLDEGKIDQYRVKLEGEVKVREALELQINRAFNQAVEAKLRAEIAAGNLTWQLLYKQIISKRNYLTGPDGRSGQHTSPENTEWEVNRLINYYVETETRKETVGEWAAILAA